VLYTLSLSPLHPSSRIYDGLKHRVFKTNNLHFYNRLFFVKYFLIEQIVLDMVRCYSNNQYQAEITTQFYYNKTEIELKAYEVILKSGNTQTICLVPPRIDALLAERATSPVRLTSKLSSCQSQLLAGAWSHRLACSHLYGTLTCHHQ
jgi:hypothetical protein